MANPADKYAKKTFSQLESQMSRQYREAYKDINEKLKDFTRKHKAKDKQMQRDLKNGKITQEQYASWLRGQVFIGQQWQNTKASLDLSIKNVMTEAAHLTHQKSIDVFVDNANHTAYQIEKDHGFAGGINFTMYDRNTVSRLMLEDPELLPRRRDINGNKLSAWNTRVIANCVTQSVLQGESINELSRRIARDTCIDAGRSSLLYARTAMTGAQNAGRVERMKEAESMGIKVQKMWMATLDSRTRDTHASLDGEIADTNKKFPNGLKYPGDPDGKPSEVYNCRCTLVYHYPEYSDYSKMERTAYYEEGDPEYDPNHRKYEIVRGMDYEQWVDYKQDQIRQRYGGPSSKEQEVPATLRRMPEYTEEYMSSHSGETGLTQEQLNELSGMLDTMYGNSDVYSYVGDTALDDILNGGRQKNYFERAGRSISASEEELRYKVTDTLFGIDSRSMDPREYEKYGFFGSSDTLTAVNTQSRADTYGRFCLKYSKESMNGRVTYTFGDSLIDIDTGRTVMAGTIGDKSSVAGIPVDRISSSYRKMRTLDKNGTLDATKVSSACVGRTGYIEAQIHGAVTKDDIEEVITRYMWNGSNFVPRGGTEEQMTLIERRLSEEGIGFTRWATKMEKDPDTGKFVDVLYVLDPNGEWVRR